MNLILLLPAIALSGFVSFISYFKKPDWFEEFGTHDKWFKIVNLSFAAAIIAIITSGIALDGSSSLTVLAFSITTGLVTVALIQSLFTDFKLRRVDRNMLNAASVLSALVTVPYLVVEKDWQAMIVASAVLAFAFFVYLFVFSVGASDARALVLVSVAAIPMIGLNGFIWASLGAGIYFIVIGLGVAFILRTLKSSFPAVPMLLFPYWVVMILVVHIDLANAIPTV